jgi:IS1 family transposase
LKCKRIQVDEIWSYVGAKDKNIPAERQGESGIGSVWIWTAIDADSKLISSWLIGTRDAGTASDFLYDLRQRLANRVQLTSPGRKAYLKAVDYAFSGEPHCGVRSVFHVLQLRPHPPNHSHRPRNGCWRLRETLGDRGHRGPSRSGSN